MSVTRSGWAFGLLGGAYAETIAWTIGPQTGPAKPPTFGFGHPFPLAESLALPTGEVLSLNASFTITSGGTTVTGTKGLVANGGNWGICQEFVDASPGGFFPPPAPYTGEVYVLHAGVLSYEATVDDGVNPPAVESGLAESYLMNGFVTCCDSNNPTQVNHQSGHLEEGFGTTHPEAGTSGDSPTTQGVNVVVQPLSEVVLTFDSVDGAGTTTAVKTTSVPPLPTGFQVGVPPAYYEISTTASFSGVVEVCIGYGGLPPGVEPDLLHYEDGAWTDVTTSFTQNPNVVCGMVNSLSPFAVAYSRIYDVSGPFQPVDPQPTVNSMKAGRTVPVKFSLGGDYGLDVFADGYPASQQVACDSHDPLDDVEITSSTNSGLAYDSAIGRYHYNWKTQSSWKGSCRTLILKFSDGQELRAAFKFS